MASRKKRECHPHDTNCSATICQIDRALPERQFHSVVRMIATAALDKVMPLLAAFEAQLKTLGVRQNGRKAISGVPDGSDQVDVGSVIRWAGLVCQHDPDAINQLVALHATAYRRCH